MTFGKDPDYSPKLSHCTQYSIISLMSCGAAGSHSGITENSSLLVCYAVLTGK